MRKETLKEIAKEKGLLRFVEGEPTKEILLELLKEDFLQGKSLGELLDLKYGKNTSLPFKEDP